MKPKFLVGGAVIAAALVYMIYAGVTQSAVYFVTPSELEVNELVWARSVLVTESALEKVQGRAA